MEEQQPVPELQADNQEEKKPEDIPLPKDSNRFEHWKNWYLSRKKWTIPASVIVFIIILALIPLTRYDISGLVIKKTFKVEVLDSETNTPVSGADVSMLLKTAQTDSSGVATLKNMKPGSHSMLVHKKYYSDDMRDSTVPLLGQKKPYVIKLVATGRQTKVTVKNLISKIPLADVTIKAADTTATTDKNGEAIIVLPSGTSSQKADLSLSGYNNSSVDIKASDANVVDNEVTMTPAGKVYFLSKLSGKIDVIKTNLDGSDRQTVLAGTGEEDDQGTVLLASRDWKYLALLSRRAGSFATLYLIDTSNDSLSTIDEGNATFSLVGWSNDNFVYTVNRNTVQNWQAKKQSLKSFNATNKQITLLDNTAGIGTSSYDYAYEYYGYNIYLIGGNIIYTKTWQGRSVYTDIMAGKTAGIYKIGDDGKNPQTLKTFAYSGQADNVYLGSVLRTPSQLYFQQLQDQNENYFLYSNGKLTAASGINSDQFSNYLNDSYITYLQSPSGNSTFWTEQRDGKNTLFIGDQNGLNAKQIATLSDYNNYGWYTDNYLLVSKNSSELYIMPRDSSQPPVKISDYHKPAINYNGYGGGYGGV